MTGIKLAMTIRRLLDGAYDIAESSIDPSNPNVINVRDNEGRQFMVIVHRKEDAE